MKYIKTYNEAIGPKLTRKEFVGDEETGSTQSVPSTGYSPAVFRSASSVANRSNQPNKGAILADYADEKEYGYYNLTVLRNRTGYLIKDVKATDFKITNVYYGVPRQGETSLEVMRLGYNVSDVINNWVNGNRTLGLTFDVSFRLLNSTKAQLKKNTNFDKLITNYQWIPFSVTLVMSRYAYGMDDFLACDSCNGSGQWECYACDGSGYIWDTEADKDIPCPDCEGKGTPECGDCSGRGNVSSVWKDGQQIPIERDENGKPIYDQQAFFEDTKQFELIMSPRDTNSDTFTAVFSDKRSAIEFTKDLPKMISSNKNFKDRLTELLGILSHEPSEDLAEAMKVFSKVSNNALLPEDPRPISSNNGGQGEAFYNKFFYRTIAKLK